MTEPPKTPQTCPDCRGRGVIEFALDQTDPGAGLGTEPCKRCRGYGILTP